MFSNYSKDIGLLTGQSKHDDKPIVSLSASDSKDTSISTFFNKTTSEVRKESGDEIEKENVVDLTQESRVKIKMDDEDKTSIQFPMKKIT